MRVAVLGAGFQGVCVALELARRGCSVDLYDGMDRPVTRAGLVNEGKIHLGFVYANEKSRRTADLMIEGALAYGDLIGRWCGLATLDDVLSTPFVYGVHRETMVATEAIERHFAHVGTRIQGRRYLGTRMDAPYRRLTPGETAGLFDGDQVADAFWTGERSVHTGLVAERLRAALLAESRVTFLPRNRILSAMAGDDAVTLSIEETGQETGGHRRERYRQVVNCLWEGRRVIDQTFGLPPDHQVLYRFKIGIALDLAQPMPESPSATLILGRFGDCVSFGGKSLYLSWYPACMIAKSQDLAPPDWEAVLDDAGRDQVYASTLDALGAILPALRGLDDRAIVGRRISGAAIVARGTTDIDDPASNLHSRFEVGIRSQGGYHTVDPGKYTMAPLFAVQAADRVLGTE